jgi:MFS family permease
VGLSLWQIGLILTGGLLTATIYNLFIGFLVDHVGRKKVLITFGSLATLSGFVFALTSDPIILSFVGIVSAMGSRGGFGPVQMVERVIIAQTSPDDKRTLTYAIRSTLNSIADSAGSLFTGMAILIQNWYNITEIGSLKIMFILYAFLNLVTVLLYSQLSKKVEIKESFNREHQPLSTETKKNTFKLSLLFSMDTFGSGFTTPSLVSYWFFIRFGLNIDMIGVIFSVSGLLKAASYLIAARISDRIGLIKTMFLSHFPAQIMTMSIPFMPTITSSVIVFLSRSLLSSMDVPTRQSYIMAIVKPEERSRVAGTINIPRSFTYAISPSLAGFIMQFIGNFLPFIIAGGIKATYDVTLYLTFKKIRPPEEQS